MVFYRRNIKGNHTLKFQYSDEENDISSAILAYYLFSPTELDSDDNHKYVEVASAPFLSAQNDFSSYQLGVFKKIIESSMSFDE